jgi:hypothetical protein
MKRRSAYHFVVQDTDSGSLALEERVIQLFMQYPPNNETMHSYQMVRV